MKRNKNVESLNKQILKNSFNRLIFFIQQVGDHEDKQEIYPKNKQSKDIFREIPILKNKKPWSGFHFHKTVIIYV